MGDYVTLVNGDRIKIGTAGDNRYMRRSECEELAKQDTRGEARGNLSADQTRILWRFPWPDEDGDGVAQIESRDMFRSVLFVGPAGLVPPEEHGDGSGFGDGITVHVNPKGGGYGVNVCLPCPERWGRIPSLKNSGHTPGLIRIVGERFDNQTGQARTILECPWCEKPFAISPDEAGAVQAALIDHWGRSENRKWAEAIAERIQPDRRVRAA